MIHRIFWCAAGAALDLIASVAGRLWRFARFLLALNSSAAALAVQVILGVQLVAIVVTGDASMRQAVQLLSFVGLALALRAGLGATDGAAKKIATATYRARTRIAQRAARPLTD